MSCRHQRNRRNSLGMLLASGLLAAGILGLTPPSAQAITGGNDVTDDSFGFVAEVTHTPSGRFCTGTLISSRWVLTAAHCVGGVTDPRVMQVRVGNNVRSSGGQVRRADSVRSYPAYSGGHNDVALLRLDSPVYGIAPVQLANYSLSPRWDGYGTPPFTRYDDGIAVGWGVNSAGQFPNRLQFRGVDIHPAGADNAGIKYIPTGPGACGGDSGGPLLIYFNSRLYQVGVTKAASCGNNASYSEVGAGYLQDWIFYQLQIP